MTATPPFDPQRFAELRRQQGARWGAAFHYANETGSTNDDALAAARAGAESGSVFLADHQTQGRGRRGKTWLAEPGHGLLFSIVLRPEGGSSLVSALTLAVGLGVRAALAEYMPAPLGVKWPNDVLAGRRKLAGILCEGQFEGGRLEAVVLGIGINVYAGSQPLPAELAGEVTCLEQLAQGHGQEADPNLPGGAGLASHVGLARAEAVAPVVGNEREHPPRGGKGLARERVLVDVLAAVEARVSTCLEGGFTALLREFSEHDALAGQQVVISGASPITGVARGVDGEGRLLVESDGLLIPVVSGTVRAVWR